jgi:hypothetical protein
VVGDTGAEAEEEDGGTEHRSKGNAGARKGHA